MDATRFYFKAKRVDDMKEFICYCLATVMAVLAFMATAMFICSFWFVEFRTDTEAHADNWHFFSCHFEEPAKR